MAYLAGFGSIASNCSRDCLLLCLARSTFLFCNGEKKATWRIATTEREMDEEEKEDAPSQLALTLLRKWAWGRLSTPELQELAHAALKDHLLHPQIEKLASIGSWGLYPGNMQRDLMHYLEKSSPLADSTCMVSLRLLVEGDTWADTDCSPGLLTSSSPTSFTSDLEVFQDWILGGDGSKVGQFWKDMKDHPIVQAGPELGERIWPGQGSSSCTSRRRCCIHASQEIWG